MGSREGHEPILRMIASQLLVDLSDEAAISVDAPTGAAWLNCGSGAGTFEPGIDRRAADLEKWRESRRAVYPAPYANLSRGPKLGAAAAPTK